MLLILCSRMHVILAEHKLSDNCLPLTSPELEPEFDQCHAERTRTQEMGLVTERSHSKIRLISFYAHLKANGSSRSTRARVFSFYGNHQCTYDQDVNFVTLLMADKI